MNQRGEKGAQSGMSLHRPNEMVLFLACLLSTHFFEPCVAVAREGIHNLISIPNCVPILVNFSINIMKKTTTMVFLYILH